MSLNDGQLYTAINKFLAAQDQPKVAWLKGRYTQQLYLRRDTYHALGQDMSIRMLDVANITVKPVYRGRGVLTNLLAWLEAKNLPLYIENVLNDRLNAFFTRRRGYQPGPIERCYFWLPKGAVEQ